MLDSLLNEIYLINPLLGDFVKLSFISLVVMISIIPLSFFISLLNGAMNARKKGFIVLIIVLLLD